MYNIVYMVFAWSIQRKWPSAVVDRWQFVGPWKNRIRFIYISIHISWECDVIFRKIGGEGSAFFRSCRFSFCEKPETSTVHKRYTESVSHIAVNEINFCGFRDCRVWLWQTHWEVPLTRNLHSAQ